MPSTCIKIIGRGVLCLFSVVVALYLAVELFLHFNAVEISHSDLMPQSNLELSQMQLDLAGHILHKSKEPRFSPTLWVQDLIQFNNEIASFVAASFLNRTLPLSTRSLKRQVVQLATARRLAGRAAFVIIYIGLFRDIGNNLAICIVNDCNTQICVEHIGLSRCCAIGDSLSGLIQSGDNPQHRQRNPFFQLR